MRAAPVTTVISMPPEETQPLRLDYQIITQMIEPDSRVLDLGCGDGELLSLLIKQKNCKGTGVEIDQQAIFQCIAKGLTVSHGDINSGLSDYSGKRFDYVILNESLQQVLQPQKAILEALRVGKKIIVGIPNFCHIAARFQIFFFGQVPITRELPYEWYNTPNLRFFSLKDFQAFCKTNNIRIVDQQAIDSRRIISFMPNLFALIGIFLLEKP
jgi:methionine biosynthesis protein MetW